MQSDYSPMQSDEVKSRYWENSTCRAVFEATTEQCSKQQQQQIRLEETIASPKLLNVSFLIESDLITFSPNNNLYQTVLILYRSNHSTESALNLTLDNIHHAIDLGKSTLLAPLDLSATFHMIDPSILIICLQTYFGLNCTVLQWISSYHSNTSQFVKLRQSKSSISPCTWCIIGLRPRSYYIHFIYFLSFLHRIISVSFNSKILMTCYCTSQFHALCNSSLDHITCVWCQRYISYSQ